MAKFAQGKFQQHFMEFEKEVKDLKFEHRNYSFNDEELAEQVHEMMELLISIPEPPPPPP